MTSRDPQWCCEAVRSAILATAWLLVSSLADRTNGRAYATVRVASVVCRRRL